MKFGKQLELGVYLPWHVHYVAYARLKRVIKRNKFIIDAQRVKAVRKSMSRASETPPLGSYFEPSELTPLTALNLNNRDNLEPNDLYRYAGSVEEGAMGGDVDISSAGSPIFSSGTKAKQERRSSHGSNPSSGGENIEDFFSLIREELDKVNTFFVGKIAELKVNLDTIAQRRNNEDLRHHVTRSIDPRNMDELRSLYVELSAIRVYCSLNQTAFVKIIKKYDKTFSESNLGNWNNIIDKQPFTVSSEPVQCLDIIQNMVSRERLIEWERLAETGVGLSRTDDIFPAVKGPRLLFACLIFIISCYVPLVKPGSSSMSDDDDDNVHPNVDHGVIPDHDVGQYMSSGSAGRCLSVLLFVVCLWLSEALPYYATSLLIAPLCVLMDLFKDPDNPMQLLNRQDAAKMVMSAFLNHTSMLLLGGFAISAAFSRCQLELRAAAVLQSTFKQHPLLFLLAIMLLGLVLSMWISNHTAPILVGAIVTPIVRDLPRDSKYSKAILLGLAYSCNFGGMMTPISSLQNALAVSVLEHTGIEVGFGNWICFGAPFALLCTLMAWIWLIVVIEPYDIDRIPLVVYEVEQATWSKRNLVVMLLSLLTVILFAFSELLRPIIGDISTISLCFVGTIFGSGMLTEVDFNGLPFHLLFLVGGGNILGKAVESSGLLKDIAVAITSVLPLDSRIAAMGCIYLFTAIASTFVSHTVASLIVMPVISQVGVSLEAPLPVVVGTALAVSAAMALPISSFPNVNSFLIADDFRKPYLKPSDFVRTGLPLSIISVALITYCAWLLEN